MPTYYYDPAQMAEFKVWLEERGAEVREETNEWECARFRFKSRITKVIHTAVIYRNKHGEMTFTGNAWTPWGHFLKKDKWKMDQGWRSDELNSHPTPEAEFHKRIKLFLNKTEQGRVMAAFREVMTMEKT